MMDAAARPPFLRLPGFADDAVPFAFRTALALVLAYYVAFAAQVSSPNSAGVTVGIIAQASTGMALSKAFYRMAGTVIGFVVAILLAAWFGQDRTMLLLAFAVWMSLCSAAASLLRDFRSYGAALSGYTVAIIAIGSIDDPDGLFLAGLNRAAAVMIGILSVALVNMLLGGRQALAGLLAALRARQATVIALALDALEGRPVPDVMGLARTAAGLTALNTEANYVAAEQPDGRRRRNGARVAIGSLLTVISASRTVAGSMSAASAVARRHVAAVAQAIRAGTPPPAPPPLAGASPVDVLLIERADAVSARLADAALGLRVLAGGPGRLPRVVLRPTIDAVAAFIAAARTFIAFAATAAFAAAAGWPGATLVLIQEAALVGLLGTLPAPTKAAIAFAAPLLPAAALAGIVAFVLLPVASGFVPFALAVGSAMALVALLARHNRLLPYGPAAAIYVPLLLNAGNPQGFDLATFASFVLQVGSAAAFTILGFVLILPVSPKRRLYRVAAAVSRDLARTRTDPAESRAFDPPVAQSRLFDRLARALIWVEPGTGARHAFMAHTYRLGATDIALHRARSGLAHAVREVPALAPLAAMATRALTDPAGPACLAAARALLDHPAAAEAAPAVMQAVSGIADAAFQEGRDHGVSRFQRAVG